MAAKERGFDDWPRDVIGGGAYAGCIWYIGYPMGQLEITRDRVAIRCWPLAADTLAPGEGTVLVYRGKRSCRVRISPNDSAKGSTIFWCGNPDRVEATLERFGWSDHIEHVQLGIRRRWKSVSDGGPA